MTHGAVSVYSGTVYDNLAIGLDGEVYDKSRIPRSDNPDALYVVLEGNLPYAIDAALQSARVLGTAPVLLEGRVAQSELETSVNGGFRVASMRMELVRAFDLSPLRGQLFDENVPLEQQAVLCFRPQAHRKL